MSKKLSSIQTKIALITILFVTIAVVTAIGVNFSSLTGMAHDTLVNYTEDSLTEIVKAYGKGIDESIEKYNSTMTYLDNSENFYVFSVNNGNKFSNEIHASLSKYLEANDTHESISYVAGSDMTVLASTDAALEGTPYGEEPFVQYIMENNAPAQSDVFFDEESGEPMISIGVPLRSHFDDETLSGVLFTNVKVSLFADALTGISVYDSDTSYACLLDSNGVYIYHPDESLIGTKSGSAVTADLVSRIASGTAPAVQLTSDDSARQYLAYNVSPLNNWILCLVVDQNVILDPIDNMRQHAVTTSVAICLIIIAIFMVLGFIFAGTITTPIKAVTKVISKTADLDISQDDSYHPLLKHKDETGEMSRAVQKMRQAFGHMMRDISSTSERISESAEELQRIATTVNDNANSNSSTAEELSASMEQTAFNTQSISNEIREIEQNTSNITTKAREGVTLSEEIMNRAEKLKADTRQASGRTKNMYESVKTASEAAIERSRAVSKIDELATNIMEISSRTSLLSLNASIEAARAGEQGRGFAVVAGEIGKLAEQSSRTVGSITQIVAEVNAAVGQMEESLNSALEFLDQTVLADYENFLNISERYTDDAGFVNRTMSDIDGSIDELNRTISNITGALAQINGSIAETSAGVSNVVDSNANLVALAEDTYSMVKQTSAYADSLKEIVDSFTLS